MQFSIISLFPSLFDSPLNYSVMRRAQVAKLVAIKHIDLREFASDRHRTTDDYPFGGGHGMVLKPEPVIRAIEYCRRESGQARVILLSPRGRVFNQALAKELSQEGEIVLICGRYEGVDERVMEFVDDSISIGDYTLSGGEIPALVVIDAVSRLIPGVLGNEDSAREDSFTDGLLEYPQYTRPARFRGMRVPEILLSGNHEAISRWRRAMSLDLTQRLRPDLLKKKLRTRDPLEPDRHHPRPNLYLALLHFPVVDKNGAVVTSSITNLDIHDIARACRTYGVKRFYIVHPVETLRKLAAKIINHWREGYGSVYNDTRKEALSLVRLVDALEDSISDIQRECRTKPRLIATSARRPREEQITTFSELKNVLEKDQHPYLILLGTGWGLDRSVFARADSVLEPIEGGESYNHLSVRSAAAILLDRILGTYDD